MDVELNNLKARLDRLESQNRRLKRWGGSLCVLLLIIGTIGWKSTIDEQLIIRDRNGKTRFDMGVHQGNGLSNGLLLFDFNGNKRIHIGIDQQGTASIELYNPDGTVRQRIQ